MNSNTRTVLWVIAGLLVVIIVIGAIIAAVLLGPTVMTALHFGGTVASQGSEKVSDATSDIGNAIEKATAPSGTSPRIAGINGVIAMMKADPAYNGGGFEQIDAQGCAKHFENLKKSDDQLADADIGNVVAVRYNGIDWYFYPFEQGYQLILIKQSVFVSATGQTITGWQGIGIFRDDNTPPITLQEENWPSKV